MSFVISGRLWALQIAPTAKAVLMALADQANDAGVCWPSIRTLCVRTCFGERAVRNALRALEEAGLLEVEVGAMKSNRYTLRIDGLPTGASASPRHDVPGAPDAGRPASGAGHPGTSCPQTISEPTLTDTSHIPPSKGANPTLEGIAEPPKRAPIAFRTFLDECRRRGEKPIPESDPVFTYCQAVGIDRDTLALHWREFKRKRLNGNKRQRDWRQAFRNSVEGNWFRLWYLQPDGSCALTTQGLQARSAMLAEQKCQAALEQQA